MDITLSYVKTNLSVSSKVFRTNLAFWIGCYRSLFSLGCINNDLDSCFQGKK